MENDKIIIVTEEVKKIIKNKKIKIKEDLVYNKKTINKLINIKNKRIIIYDITYCESKNKILKINDHINKTGENPIIGNQKKLKTDFIDITKIYKESRNGVITTSVGKKGFKKIKKKIECPSTEICNIAILCKVLNLRKIEGRLINLFQLV